MKKYLLLLLLSGFAVTSCEEKPQLKKPEGSIRIDTTGSGTSFIYDLHKKNTLKTYDQSVEDFLKSNPRRPDSIRKVIYLLPLGDMDSLTSAIITAETDYLQKFFQLEVKVMPGVAFDDLKRISKIKTRMATDPFDGKKGGPHNGDEEQIEANSLIKNYIVPNMPKDAIVVIGVTAHDIYGSGYNYLFGTSSLKDGTGLVSVHRLMGFDPEMNIRKVISKQVTNVFSINNVKDYDCLLNFHNNSDELEKGTVHLSPIALQKLKLAIGFDYKKRTQDLLDFWKQKGHLQNSDYYAKCLKALNSQSSAANTPK